MHEKLMPLLQVLRPQRLMYMEIGDFDAIMQSCGRIFTYWDDEQQNLHTVTGLDIFLPDDPLSYGWRISFLQMFREMSKKQKQEMKYSYRIQLRHKNLEARLDDLQKFRKQHEQLSNVIARLVDSF